MTMIEMTIGMIITTMVIGALGAVWYSVAETWRSSNSSQNVSATASQAVARMEGIFREARYVGMHTAGSVDGSAAGASAFVWRGPALTGPDTWAMNVNGSAKSTVPDGIPQVGELLLIEHDPATKRIYYYEPIDSSAMNASQLARASQDVTGAELDGTTLAASFKTSDLVQKKVLTEACTGAFFNYHPASGSTAACMEFTLKITRTGGSSMVYGTTTFRCPSRRPN
jgi:Tfp pilus assembly protein PilW